MSEDAAPLSQECLEVQIFTLKRRLAEQTLAIDKLTRFTLRDRFAIAAAATLTGMTGDFGYIAEKSYMIADACIAERTRPKQAKKKEAAP